MQLHVFISFLVFVNPYETLALVFEIVSEVIPSEES